MVMEIRTAVAAIWTFEGDVLEDVACSRWIAITALGIEAGVALNYAVWASIVFAVRAPTVFPSLLEVPVGETIKGC